MNEYSECFIPNLPIQIKDRPHFLHRGVMIDVARNFIPIPKLKEVVQLMSQVKLNVLHLHLTDSQSWPVEIEESPYLSLYASFNNVTYKREELKDLVSYSRIRGVRVVPELAAPGNSPMDFGSDIMKSKYGVIS